MSTFEKICLFAVPIMAGSMLLSAYATLEGAAARRELAASNDRLTAKIERMNALAEEIKQSNMSNKGLE